MSCWDNDIVRDILRRVVEAAQRQGGFDESLAITIEQQVRRDWANTEPYIRARAESASERAEKIQELWDAGHRDTKVLAVRFGITARRVRQIVGR